jgi:hypothetical protein
LTARSFITRAITAITLGLAIIWLAAGCGRTSTATPSSSASLASNRGRTAQITTGQSVTAAKAKIDSGGGLISITQAGSPLEGLQIEVPAGAYPDSRVFKVSYAAIEKHTLGPDFNPLTPLIRVDQGAEYAHKLMELTIPFQQPEGYFVMALAYDEQTHSLAGLPALHQELGSLTFGTRCFSNFVISGIARSALKSDLDSGFRPGRDDWQFANRGSCITPEGHFSGQSLSALWYYLAQPDGPAATLWGRYDNNSDFPATPDFELDDSRGWRLAATLQNDLERELAVGLQPSQQSDELTQLALVYSLQLTGRPQIISLASPNENGQLALCYAWKDHQLYIADPNYPGDRGRHLNLVDGRFEPYLSGSSRVEIARGHTVSYENIGYTGWAALVDWQRVARRWAELRSGTIGEDLFPPYTLVYKDARGQPQTLKEGFLTHNPKIYIGVKTGTEAGLIIYREVFREGAALERDSAQNIELKPGQNHLGLYVAQALPDGRNLYIDFRYLNLIYQP